MRRYAAKEVIRFHTPGHRGGRWLSNPFAEVLGAQAASLDVSDVLEGAGPITSWTDALDHAQRRTAELFGASASRFLVNGTSGGIHAAVMALAAGGNVACSRASHVSVFAACILHRCTLTTLPVNYDPQWDIPGPLPVDQIVDCVRASRADVYIETYPNYYGLAPPLDQITAQVPDVAVLVDEAHGSHFGFCQEAPRPALECGAHLSVQSFHKTLGALTQASVLHVHPAHADLVPRVDRALFLLQTTSASPLLLSSLEAATVQAAQCALDDWIYAVELADALRRAVSDRVGCRTLTPQIAQERWASGLDPARVVINVGDIGWGGPDAADVLRRRYNIQVEMANRRCLVLLISPGNREEEIEVVVDALQGLRELEAPRPLADGFVPPPLAERAMPPWDAVAAPIEWVPLSKSVGRVSAEVICPYPPGIPAILPGEEVTRDVAEYLEQVRRGGTEVRGATYQDLSRIGVVR